MTQFAQSGKISCTSYPHEPNQRQLDSQIPLGQTVKSKAKQEIITETR